MNGRQEVARLRSKLDATFKRASLIGPDPELLSDFAKYLCVLVCGYVEQAVVELLMEHSRRNGAPTLQRFVEARTSRLTNLNCEILRQVLGNFDPAWGDDIAKLLVDDTKDALNSVVSLRNNIAHGESVGLTYQRIVDYYGRIKPVIERVADLCVPI